MAREIHFWHNDPIPFEGNVGQDAQSMPRPLVPWEFECVFSKRWR